MTLAAVSARPGPPVAVLDHGRRVVLVEPPAAQPGPGRGTRGRRRGRRPDGAVGAGTPAAGVTAGARAALAARLPLVVVLRSPATDPRRGVAALDDWGRAARALAGCSGIVPVALVADGVVLGAPSLLLGLTELVIMTTEALAYVSGPAAVHELTGVGVDPAGLGGSGVHARLSGLAALVAADAHEGVELAAAALGYLPGHADDEPPLRWSADPPARPTPELRRLLPPSDTGSYDVRRVVEAVADDRELLELRNGWAPQLVTALVRIAGRPVGVVANQPQSMAGTLDIAASQKGARFVAWCDAFNVPLLTLVDTPGFMPGKDLEWRGMIRKGAELVFAYAEASVPRVCLVLRKAFGGAYIVMDSKGMGNDLCLAWPDAQVAVMGAQGAVSILHRREDPSSQAALAAQYRTEMLNPYVAAARGFVDGVIDPCETRAAVSEAFTLLDSKREHLVGRKHGNGPL